MSNRGLWGVFLKNHVRLVDLCENTFELLFACLAKAIIPQAFTFTTLTTDGRDECAPQPPEWVADLVAPWGDRIDSCTVTPLEHINSVHHLKEHISKALFHCFIIQCVHYYDEDLEDYVLFTRKTRTAMISELRVTVLPTFGAPTPTQQHPKNRASGKHVIDGRIKMDSAMELANLLVTVEESVATRVAQLDNNLDLSQKLLEEFVTLLIPLTADAAKTQSLTADRVSDMLNVVFERIDVEDPLAPVYQAVILLYTMERPYPLHHVWNGPLHEASKGAAICAEHYKAVVPLTVLLCLALASLPEEDRVFTTVTRGEPVKDKNDSRWLYFLSETRDDPYVVCAPLSTSLRHKVAEGFASGATQSLFLTVTGFGFKINKHSFFPDEDEVLIPPFSAYDIVSAKRQTSSHGELRLWVTMEPCISRLEPTQRLAQVIRVALLKHLLDECEARGLQKKIELEPTDTVKELAPGVFRVTSLPCESQNMTEVEPDIEAEEREETEELEEPHGPEEPYGPWQTEEQKEEMCFLLREKKFLALNVARMALTAARM